LVEDQGESGGQTFLLFCKVVSKKQYFIEHLVFRCKVRHPQIFTERLILLIRKTSLFSTKHVSLYRARVASSFTSCLIQNISATFQSTVCLLLGILHGRVRLTLGLHQGDAVGSTSKLFFIKNRFQLNFSFLSSEICKHLFNCEMLEAKAKAERASKLKTEMNKSKHKLRQDKL